ncbi:Patatin-like phospholipase domain-containing protein 3 [Myotis brandtii]|uniref:Patatin-like phospholipase domain-containing protein 3 n=1 Tax=Myotis brandtii TaxID=109478 RepID=S7QGX7_MYOBR|nr:Patatin-like phospholipase domain-containing protein 3 [Myotis brandtii]
MCFSLPHKRYVDGGFSDFRPCFDDKTTITVSPFLGEHDICPKVKSTNFLHMDVCRLSLRFCLENVYLINQSLFPPDVKVSGAVCSGGAALCSCLPGDPTVSLRKLTKVDPSMNRDRRRVICP